MFPLAILFTFLPLISSAQNLVIYGNIAILGDMISHLLMLFRLDGLVMRVFILKFLSEASVESKLSLIRDLQYNYLFSQEFELKGLIYEQLVGELNMEYEADVLINNNK